ncbi:hypothetical protein ABPG72_006134 [Tetrahymena utriculariae]
MGCNSSTTVVDFENVSTQGQAVEYVKQKLEKCENMLINIQKLRKTLYQTVQMDSCQHFLGNLYEDIHDVHKEISMMYPDETPEKIQVTKTVKEYIKQLKEMKLDFFESLSDSKSIANSDKMQNNQDILLELHWKQQTLYNYFLNNKKHNTSPMQRSLSSTSTALSV